MFRVRARNVYGYGTYSNIVTFRCSDVPEVMAILTTTLTALTSVRVAWTAPNSNFESID